MMRHLARASVALLALGAPLLAQTPSSATPWVEAPRLTVSLGGTLYQGSGEFFNMVSEALTLSSGDFRAPALGFEYSVPHGERVRLLAAADYTRLSKNSQAVGAVDLARQKTVLWTAGGGVGVQFRLRSDASVGSGDWDPYVSALGGAQGYRLFQRGIFADHRDSADIFSHTYASEAIGAFGQLGLGAVRSVSERTGVSIEVRYRFSQIEMNDDFAGFKPLDLSGVRLSVGATYALQNSKR